MLSYGNIARSDLLAAEVRVDGPKKERQRRISALALADVRIVLERSAGHQDFAFADGGHVAADLAHHDG